MLPEFGIAQLLVIAALALIFVGPKDLPVLMRKVGRFLGHMRSMAAEFRASFDEMARQSELDELRREVEAMRQAASTPLQTAAQASGLDDIGHEVEAGLTDYRAQAEASAAEPPVAPKPAAPRKRASTGTAKTSKAAKPQPSTKPSPKTRAKAPTKGKPTVRRRAPR